MQALITFTEYGLFCQPGNFYIDPWLPVDKAIITHAHSDHARWGSKEYLCHRGCKPLLELRLGAGNYQAAEWGDIIYVNGVRVSLHPAGHIIGSSQVRLEYQGETWVFSGDYKTEDDGISGAFEPIRCHSFITESTFGLPIYDWEPQEKIYDDMRSWVQGNRESGFASILIAYSLGKAQRVSVCLSAITEKIYAHGAIANAQEILRQSGFNLPSLTRITPETPREELKGAIILAPPSADGSTWMRKFQPYRTGICSGWMQVRGNRRRRNADAGFALSDHADWKGLLQAVRETGAEKIFTTHGFQSAFSRYLNDQGLKAYEVKTDYGDTEEENDSVGDSTI